MTNELVMEIGEKYTNGATVRVLCNEFRIGSPKLRAILNSLQIKIRSSKEANANNIQANVPRHKHTQETKNKLSEIRKNYLQNNPDKHVWKRNSKFFSHPCQVAKDHLCKFKYDFVEEYSGACDKNYSIDIAFPCHKIGIEINGNQHYDRIGSLKPYYQKRHDYIENHGWKIHELHYTVCYNQTDFIKIIENILQGANVFDFNYDEYLLFKLKAKKEKKKRYVNVKEKIQIQEVSIDKVVASYCICGTIKCKVAKECSSCHNLRSRKVIRPSFDILKQEVIDCGYSKVGRKYGVSDNAIRKWMKKYESDQV